MTGDDRTGTVETFRQRLSEVVERAGLNCSAFAAELGWTARRCRNYCRRVTTVCACRDYRRYRPAGASQRGLAAGAQPG